MGTLLIGVADTGIPVAACPRYRTLNRKLCAAGAAATLALALAACGQNDADAARNEATRKAMLDTRDRGHLLIKALKETRAELTDGSAEARSTDREIADQEARAAEFDAFVNNSIETQR